MKGVPDFPDHVDAVNRTECSHVKLHKLRRNYMTKERIHSAAAIAVFMVGFMVMLVCAPRAAMAADAQTAVSGTGPVSVWGTDGFAKWVITGASGSTADSLNTSTATATSVGNATGATSINGSGNTLTATTGANTINAATTNAITGGTGNTLTATTGDNTINATTGTNTINAAAANNVINAATTNAITGGTGNTVTATTGNNAIAATAGSNTISADAAGQSNTISATGAGGVNNITAPTNNIGTTAAFATANNIGTGANVSTNAIGNINAGTTVIATGGNGVLSVANTQSSLTAGAVLGTNGTSGTTSGAGSGGLTVYNAAQTVGPNTTIRTALLPTGILDGKTYQNKVNGNLLVDGNVYINGTLDYVSSNSANTTVVGGAGTSTLNSTQGTTAGTAIVMKGSTGIQTVVDGHGKLTNIVTPGAAQSTAALTLTNGDGNTHGIVVSETQTTVSGGRFSTAMTLHDDGATFANTANGEPVRVHGIADGTAPHDAVNVQQLGAGLAMVSSLAALPQVEPGKRFAIGVGTGGYMSQVALAGGLSARFRENFVFKAGAAFVPGYDGNTRPVWNAGIQYSF
jgi:hypothetical protein